MVLEGKLVLPVCRGNMEWDIKSAAGGGTQETVKNVKYPSRNAPDFIVTSLDTTVNFEFNVLPVRLEEGDTKVMSIQFQEAL